MAQFPNHYVLGEGQLANTDIYNVYTAPNNTIFLATDNGLFVYKQNQFIRLQSCEGQLGNSFFDFKTNSKGDLFVKNNKGQIFQIKDGKVSIYYEMDNNGDGDFDYYFDTKDLLSVFHGNFYKINSKGEKHVVYKSDVEPKTNIREDIIRPTIRSSGFVYFRALKADIGLKEFIYKAEELEVLDDAKIYWKDDALPDDRYVMDYLSINNYDFFLSGNGAIGSTDENIEFSIESRVNERYFPLHQGNIVARDDASGCRFLYVENDTLKSSITLFPNTFISCCFSGADGQLYLGTFGGGLIVIPNVNAVRYDSDEVFRGVDVDTNGDIYLSTRSGKIYKYSERLNLLDVLDDNVDDVAVLDNSIVKFNGDTTFVITSVLPELPVLKDFVQTENGVLAAGNGGLMFFPFYNLLEKIPSYFNVKKIDSAYVGTLKYSNNNVIHNFSNVAFDPQNEVPYVSNYLGVFSVFQGQFQKIKFDNDVFEPTSLLFYNDVLIIGTKQKGIYFVQNDKIIKHLNFDKNGASGTVKKIKRMENQLFLLTGGGVKILNLSDYSIASLGRDEGVNTNLIYNFSVSSSKLVILENEGFYSLNLREIYSDSSKVSLDWNLDSLLIAKEKMNSLEFGSFSYFENDLKLCVDFLDESKKEEAYYVYQLEGFDENERKLSAYENTIYYQSIPPGLYTMNVQLHYRDFTSEKWTYSFEIRAPFWQRWWFYLMIVFSVVLIAYLFFRSKLKIQMRHNNMVNELNQSKLVAIQSQMNPHFVFNSLNSIQYLVLDGKTESAYHYIATFSSLVRKTLEFSDLKSVPISEEVKLLNTYLALESLRFGDSFSSSVVSNLVSDFKIPPMLIQPFVENALVHGLLHVEGQKELKIELEVVGNCLHCIIWDNGIGRKESQKINSQRNKQHRSFALSSIDNRFAILRQNVGKEVLMGYEYSDLSEEEFYATKVTVMIPIDK